MSLKLRVVNFAEATEFVRLYHRHHRPAQGHKYSIGAEKDGALVGVVCVGIPTSPKWMKYEDGNTLEVTRCCVAPEIKNGCSFLYGAAWRVAKNLGYSRLITFVLISEPGTSLKAAGWKFLHTTQANAKRSNRKNDHPLEAKQLYLISEQP